MNIEPAFKKKEMQMNWKEGVRELKDKNSLINVLMRKGEKKVEIIDVK